MTDPAAPMKSIKQQFIDKVIEFGWMPATVLQSLEQNSSNNFLHALRRIKRLNDTEIQQVFEAIGIPAANLSYIDPEAANILDEETFESIFETHKLMPIGLSDTTVTIVMDDPTSAEALAAIQPLVGRHISITYARHDAQRAALANAVKLYYLHFAFDDARPHFQSVPDDIYEQARAQATSSDTVAHALVRIGAMKDAEAFSALARFEGLPFQAFLPQSFDTSISEEQARRLNAVVTQRNEDRASVVTDHPDNENRENIAQALQLPLQRVTFTITTPAILDASYDSAYSAKRIQRPPQSLTEALIRQGALPESARDDEKAPDTALKQGQITEEQLGRALALYRNLPFIEPEENPPQNNVIGNVPEHILKEHRAFPHSINTNGELVILIADPRQKNSINAITRNVKGTVVFAIATPTAIAKLLHTNLISRQNIDKLSEEVKTRAAARQGVEAAAQEDNTTLKVVHDLINEAVIDRASDIHLEQREDGLHVRYRIDGELDNRNILPAANASSIITTIKNLARLKIEEKHAFQSGRIAYRRDDLDLNLRVETSRINAGIDGGEQVVMRILHKTVNLGNLESLLFSPANASRFRNVITRPNGIIIFCGPTGSGKTTTIFTALKEISTPARKTITIEDPVEITLPGISQHEVNPARKVTMSTALRSFLRQDPDVILVGETRDAETAKVAIEAALTGHLVITSLHTNTAPGAITRLREMGVEDFNIGASVLGVLGQRLVQRLCPNCREEYTPDAEERKALGIPEDQNVTLYRKHEGGCPQCLRRGYKGRVAVHEFLTITPAIRAAIVQHKSEKEITDIALHDPDVPFKTMREDGLWKVAQGYTTQDKVHAATNQDA